MRVHYLAMLLTVTVTLCACGQPARTAGAREANASRFETFVNPIYEGADPFVYRHTDGFYYFCQSEGDKGVSVWKSDKLTDKGVKRVVWTTPKTGWNTSEVWAPELHYLDGKWYIYYAADAGSNPDHRTGVLQSVTDDPQGEYVDKGMLYTGDHIDTGRDNRWAIDATPLRMNGRLYLIWSGWNTVHDIQSLYIAEMENPWTVKSNRVKIAENDTYDWEKVSEDPQQKGLNEGPQILRNQGKVYVIYSCSGSWEPTYKLGQLSIEEGDDPMDPRNWTKKPMPVFVGAETVHGVGHACFTASPDGRENWIVYHSKISTRPGWQRNVRIQPFGFHPDGSPDFGPPIDAGVPLKRPSGESTPTVGEDFRDNFNDNRWDRWCYYGYNRYVQAREGRFALGIDPGWGTANNYRCGEKAVIRNLIWDDFVLQARVRIVEGDRDAGLIFRVRHPAVGYDALKGYFAGIIPGTDKAILGKMDGQRWRELARSDYPCQTNTWYDLKIVAQGERIQFFINGSLAIEASDTEYSEGFAGVRVVDTHAEFDDVRISAR